MKGIWLLIYVSGLMFVMRHFAGPLAHKLSPVGLLWISCLLAAIGLILLSVANSQLTGLLAATVWGVGVVICGPRCWQQRRKVPPRRSLLMGLMGTGGTLSIYFVLPQMGKIFDAAKIRAAGSDEAFKSLSGDRLNEVFNLRIAILLPGRRHSTCNTLVGIWRHLALRPGARRIQARQDCGC
jgi:hypothetical protein